MTGHIKAAYYHLNSSLINSRYLCSFSMNMQELQNIFYLDNDMVFISCCKPTVRDQLEKILGPRDYKKTRETALTTPNKK